MSGLGSGEPRNRANPTGLTHRLNQLITKAGSLQDLVHVVNVNFSRMNVTNYCTAYHRIAKHLEDARRGRSPPESWPAARQQQLGGVLSELNTVLMKRLEEAQAQSLGITLWSISKTHQLPQQGSEELVVALQAEITARLSNVTQDVYLRDKQYNFGAQALSNIVYSAAAMGLRPNYDLLHALGRAVAWQIDEFKPQGLSNIIWALGRMGVKVTHEIRQLVEVLGREMAAQLTTQRHKAGTLAPQNISNTLHGLTNLGIAPTPELMAALMRCADEMLRLFGPQELTNAVWSLSQMHRSGVELAPEAKALLDRIPDELLLLFSDRAWRARVKPQTISNLALAYAHLHRTPQVLMAELMQEALPLLPTFKPQELSNLLWAIATMAFYPGTSTVDAITRAAAGVADRMKPQEIANSCWAWATLRHFPGAAAMDSMLACAEAQLDRFKSQELSMLCWAAAKLGYMPAAPLVRAALPHIVASRTPAVQDCGNMLWACAVLDILTPQVTQQLAERLLCLPRDQFSQEVYIQLFQAKMSLSQQVYDIAQYVPAELLAQAETEWRRQSGEYRVSVTHRDVAATMRELNIEFDVEKKIEDGLMSVDLALRGEMVAVEVDGSAHFSTNTPFVPLGRTIWRWRLLASRGWRVVTVPFFRWAMLQSMAQKKQYLYMLLQCHSVWDCFSLEPQQRDAPFHPPANLAHLTPGEVERLATEGVTPSSLLQAASSGATPAASPATPLLAGLGPAPAASSADSVGSVGLPTGLPPVPLAPADGLMGRSAASQGAAINSLPETLYSGESPRGSSCSGAGAARVGGGLNVSARPFTFGGSGAAGVSSGISLGKATTASAVVVGTGIAANPGSLAKAGTSSMGSGTSSSLAQPTAPIGQQRSAGSLVGSFGLAPLAPAFSPAPRCAAPGEAFPQADGLSAGSGNGSSSNLPASTLTGNLSGSTAASPAAVSSLPGLHVQSPSPAAVPGLRGTPKGPPQLALPQLSSPSAAAAAAAAPAAPAAAAHPSHLGSHAGSAEAPEPLSRGPAQLAGLDDDSDDDGSDLRSFFGSVIGVQPGQPQQPKGPMSVDEVQRKLVLLPASTAVADVAPGWLADWDAVRVVELLRQLDSPTTAARTVQLFEWLRGLAPDSPLAHLCTPAAYAAMIVLYGHWRKPKQAVRLFAELKERGEDGRDVHCALVEAFCSCEQAEVAMDAFRNMSAQGLLPTPATAGALLDLLVQRGAWADADAVLAGLAEHARGAAGGASDAAGSGAAGGEAEHGLDAQLFNSVIERACAASNTPAAQAAFEHMCAAGVAPTHNTFAALLGALRLEHGVDATAQLALSLVEQADDVLGWGDVGSSSGDGGSGALAAVLQACSVRGWWDLALALVAAVEGAGGRLRLEDANAVLAACAAGGVCDEAHMLFSRLPELGLQPSADSYLALVQAYCTAGRWVDGVRHFQQMLDAGLEPGEELASLAVDSLWCSGLPWAQAAALELYNQALSRRWLAPAAEDNFRGLLKVDLRARHLGTGLLCMRRWLRDTRTNIGNSSAACALDAAKRVCVFSAAPYNVADVAAAAALSAAIKAALGASLVAHKAPFRVTFEGERATRFESSAFMAKKWLFTESYQEWERAFTGSAARAAPGADTPAGVSEEALAQDQQAAEECAAAFARIRDFEAAHPPNPAAPGLAPGAGYAGQRRRELMAAVRHLAAAAGGAAPQLWHTAVVLLDRLAAMDHSSSMDAALAAACVALAAQQEGVPVQPADLAAKLDRQVTLQAVGAEPQAAVAAEMEAAVAALQGDTACVSAAHCWRVFADRLQCNTENEALVAALLGDSLARLGRLVEEEEAFCFKYPPSIQAAAVVTIARKELGAAPAWPVSLALLTGYSEDLHPQLSAALRELQKTSAFGSTTLQTVFS